MVLEINHSKLKLETGRSCHTWYREKLSHTLQRMAFFKFNVNTLIY